MKKILIQLDSDSLPSSFDRVVAVDAGVEELFSYGGVTRENLVPLIHGAIFTRGPSQLKNTAIFVGGSRVADGEGLLQQVCETFFGPMRVSVMMDSNGCNTTAAAAVAAAGQHFPLNENTAVVLGGTGPVGHRVAQLLAMEGADVTLVSRGLDRAEQTCRHIRSQTDSGTLRPAAAAAPEEVTAVCQNATMVFAAGAAGVCFLPEGALQTLSSLRIAVDLNAVPPVGIADISVTDKAAEKHGTLCYGAIGVGGLKMKVHRRAVASLFESNDRVLTTAEIYQLARQLLSNS